MYCEKCGTKNALDANFCEKCGHVLKEEDKKQVYSKLKNLPKKAKIIMSIVFLIIIVSIIVLGILLNNPVKKVEDSLTDYYMNNNDKKELIEIGKVLKSNKGQEKVLNRIKETTHRSMEKWVKNFNKEYKNKEALRENYQQVLGALRGIHEYFNGLEYMIDTELYNKYYSELENLNDSKEAYLTAKEFLEKDNEYYTYYYYQKVIEEDCYYKKAQDYINNFVQEEIKNLKEKAEEVIKIDDDTTNEEILNCYLEELKYLDNNKITNNIDLSDTEDYKKFYEEVTLKIVEYTKKVVEDKEKEEDYAEIIQIIDSSMKNISKDSNSYKDLEKLKKNYEDKLPDLLVDRNRVSVSSGTSYSSWKKEINGKEYENFLRFSFEGKTEAITYQLNKEYKKLRTTIVRGEDWDDDLTGYFVITGDGKELYKTDAITKKGELKADINIDISGINELKIEFVTTSKASGWNYFYIYLVEPYLYK